MAKQQNKTLVECIHCLAGGDKGENGMIGCNNLDRNPKGFKIGAWPRDCDYFKPKTK